jgi:hypothetical protein
MQHYRAPTRLLDWTYSPYVAAKFAAENGTKEDPVIWCFKEPWSTEKAMTIRPILKLRDKNRSDVLFKEIYMCEDRREFVRVENTFYLNERLTLQQGIFLCPGDISAPFENNLRHMAEWDRGENILKLRLNSKGKDLKEFSNNLNRMKSPASPAVQEVLTGPQHREGTG